MDYNAVAEIAAAPTEELADTWIDALDTYAPAVTGTDRGHTEIVITLPAATFDQAARTALTVLTAAVGPLTTFTVMPTAVFDERVGWWQ